MFKRPPTAKPATPLRSSSRRHLINHLNALYPVLTHCPPDLLPKVCPEQVKHFTATTSAGHKVVIYAGNDGTPWWWEAGNDAGSWISAKNSNKVPDLLPSIHSLWLIPNLIPVIPTWPQVVDPALLGGSALMIPGLLPPPHTYKVSEAHPRYPVKGQLVTIVAYPSNVPLVLARLEVDFKQAEQTRAEGGKGKAAVVLHCVGDGLADLARKSKAPESVSPISLPPTGAEPPAPLGTGQTDEDIAKETAQLQIGGGTEIDKEPENEPSTGMLSPGANFSTEEVDHILYLALLSALQELRVAEGDASGPTSLFPITSSSFYSSYVLPHRPSHYPPRPAKGKRAKQLKAGKGTPGTYGAEADGALNGVAEPRLMSAEAVVVAKSSSKKLAKWIKSVNRSGKGEDLLRLKEGKGEIAVVGMNQQHPDVTNLVPFLTIAENAALQDAASSSKDTLDGKTAAGSSAEEGSSSASSTPNTTVIIERLLSPVQGDALVRSFLTDALQLPTKADTTRKAEYYSPAELRHAFAAYISTHCETLKSNQAFVRPSADLAELLDLGASKKTSQTSPAGGRGVGGTTASSSRNSGGDPPASTRTLKREELHALFLTKCFKEHARVARLSSSADSVAKFFPATLPSSKGHNLTSAAAAAPLPSTELYDAAAASSLESNGEYVSKPLPLPKASQAAGSTPLSGSSSSFQPVRIVTKKRQGNKVVSLVTGLEVVRVDAKIWGQEVMRSLGTSVSVTPMPTAAAAAAAAKGGASASSTVPHEVLVQGDQRVYLLDKLVQQNGVPRSAVDVEGLGDKGGGKKK